MDIMAAHFSNHEEVCPIVVTKENGRTTFYTSYNRSIDGNYSIEDAIFNNALVGTKYHFLKSISYDANAHTITVVEDEYMDDAKITSVTHHPIIMDLNEIEMEELEELFKNFRPKKDIPNKNEDDAKQFRLFVNSMIPLHQNKPLSSKLEKEITEMISKKNATLEDENRKNREALLLLKGRIINLEEERYQKRLEKVKDDMPEILGWAGFINFTLHASVVIALIMTYSIPIGLTILGGIASFILSNFVLDWGLKQIVHLFGEKSNLRKGIDYAKEELDKEISTQLKNTSNPYKANVLLRSIYTTILGLQENPYQGSNKDIQKLYSIAQRYMAQPREIRQDSNIISNPLGQELVDTLAQIDSKKQSKRDVTDEQEDELCFEALTALVKSPTLEVDGFDTKEGKGAYVKK